MVLNRAPVLVCVSVAAVCVALLITLTRRAAFLATQPIRAVQPRDPIQLLARSELSNEARDTLVEELKASDVARNAEGVLKLMRENVWPTEPGIGPKPWMSDLHSHRDKVWYAAGAVWKELFSGRSDPAKCRVLLALLEAHSDDYSRYVVLDALRSHWTDEAEQPVRKLLDAMASSDDTKVGCAALLMSHRPEQYACKVIDLMEQPGASLALRERLFRTPEPASVTRVDTHQKKRWVRAGFRLLDDQRKTEPSKARIGYFVATELGELVGTQFKPDPKHPKYRSKGGLSDAFFDETVEAALAWWSKNQEAFLDQE